MRLPQHDQHLELYAADLEALADLLSGFVTDQLAGAQEQMTPIHFPYALMLKPCTKLANRLYRLHHTDVTSGRKKPRRLRIEYDELLILRTLQAFLGSGIETYHLREQIDKKSLNLSPTFKV